MALNQTSSLSELQTFTIQFLPRISAPASFLGSLLIVLDIYKLGWERTLMFQRILLFMSLTDMANSIAFFSANLSIPPPDGVGNQATCEAQGWMLQFGLAIPIWNAILAVNYLLRIQYDIPEAILKRKQYIYHIVAWVWPCTTAFACLFLGLYNDALLWCWIAPFPSGCGPTGLAGIPCERGIDFVVYQFVFFFGPLWICFMVVFVCMWMIYRHVVEHEKLMKISGVAVGGKTSSKVRRQAFLYSSAFLITWMFGSVNRLYQAGAQQNLFPIVALHSFFVPAQGFFNFLAYKFPEISAWMRRKGYCQRFDSWSGQADSRKNSTKSTRSNLATKTTKTGLVLSTDSSSDVGIPPL